MIQVRQNVWFSTSYQHWLVDHTMNTELVANLNNHVKLFLLIKNNNRVQSKLPRNQTQRSIFTVFETIANQNNFTNL
jgi:hypothetical protein